MSNLCGLQAVLSWTDSSLAAIKKRKWEQQSVAALMELLTWKCTLWYERHDSTGLPPILYVFSSALFERAYLSLGQYFIWEFMGKWAWMHGRRRESGMTQALYTLPKQENQFTLRRWNPERRRVHRNPLTKTEFGTVLYFGEYLWAFSWNL